MTDATASALFIVYAQLHIHYAFPQKGDCITVSKFYLQLIIPYLM